MQATKPDPELRTPMPWTAERPNAGFAKRDVKAWKEPKPDFPVVNVAAQIDAPDSMWALYKKLVMLNASSPALRQGRRIAVSASDRDVYAQMRETEGEIVLVLGNLSKTARAGAELTVEQSPLRAGWRMSEELEDASLAAPRLTPAGGFDRWKPLETLAPEAVYVVRWRK